MQTLICSKCKKEKNLNKFGKSSQTKSGKKGECKECRKIEYNLYHAKYREQILTKKKIFNDTHKQEAWEYRQKTKEYKRQYDIQYREKNKEKINKNHFNRLKNNIFAKLAHAIRNRTNSAIKDGQKGGSAVKDLGCCIQELKTYLEFKFYSNPKTGEQMTWDNWTNKGWHIDHIIPLCKFNLIDREQFLKACHYTNLQPMWWFENLSKGGW